MKLELYFAPGACSFVPHFGLEAIKAATGQDFEPKLVKLHKGENKTPEYLGMNPNAQVPVLVVDGQVLTQIVAICDFLDRRFPQAGLLPTEPWARSKALSDLAWFNNTVHPAFTHFFMPHKFADDEAAQSAMKSRAIRDYRLHLERIQHLLEHADPFLGGAQPNLIDAYSLVLYRWGGITGIDPASIPMYRDYVERLALHPAIKAALERERVPLQTFRAA